MPKIKLGSHILNNKFIDITIRNVTLRELNVGLYCPLSNRQE